MQLSDNEKRDIFKFLEAGKPLPEKYRFLLFNDNREVELVWNGKTNEVTNVVLPFQTIEQIDEPRSNATFGNQNSLFDTSGRQITGWTNKLIWGDNKLILSSLKNGPMRKEIEAQGGLKLIYIDPPFDVGADFSTDITIGDGDDEMSFTKKPSVIEEIAFRDTWGKGADSFIAMIYERLKLMHDLLAEDGSIYVHCDYRVNSYMRLILDEIFGKNNFINEIIWKRRGGILVQSKQLGNATDTILFYSKSDRFKFHPPSSKEDAEEYIEERFKFTDENGRRYRTSPMVSPSYSPSLIYSYKDYQPPKNGWSCSISTMERWDKEGKLVFPKEKTGRIQRKQYLDEWEGRPTQSLWADIPPINPQAKERLDYPTQKPEKLIERIFSISTDEGDLVADFFCGSGTTLAVAEKLGRKWIGSDLGKFGIHTSRKRLVGVQRELKKEGKDFRAFEILNVGKYERNAFLTTNIDLRVEEKIQQAKQKEREFVQLIISAYKAEAVGSFVNLVAKKRDRLIAIGPINIPVSSKFIQDIIDECVEKNLAKIDVLGFDYEMGTDFTEYKNRGLDIVFKIIPREVFDKKAVENGQVKFYDVAYIEIEPVVKGRGNLKELCIELTDFSVFYNQDDSGEIVEALRPGGVKIIIENGQVIKVSKDKKTDLVSKEILTKKWSDWIDYWAVDFDFASRKEFIRVPRTHGDTLLEKGKVQNLLEYDEVWTGDYIFDNEWQSFRTKSNRNIELTSVAKEVSKGTYKVAVKVVDIFGNDTTRVVEVEI